jgi:hypothetical protein
MLGVRTWKCKYANICVLMRLSGAIWEEETYTIRLDHEHYTGHIKQQEQIVRFSFTCADISFVSSPVC